MLEIKIFKDDYEKVEELHDLRELIINLFKKILMSISLTLKYQNYPFLNNILKYTIKNILLNSKLKKFKNKSKINHKIKLKGTI